MSETLQKIRDYKVKLLIELLSQCTSEQQLVFNRMYSPKNLSASIEDVCNKLPDEKYNWAVSQCETTIANNIKKKSRKLCKNQK